MKISEIKNQKYREITLDSIIKSTDGFGYVLNNNDIQRGLKINIEYIKKEINGDIMEMIFCNKGEKDDVCIFFINNNIENKYYNKSAIKMFNNLKNI
jgi:hypothetical protein